MSVGLESGRSCWNVSRAAGATSRRACGSGGGVSILSREVSQYLPDEDEPDADEDADEDGDEDADEDGDEDDDDHDENNDDDDDEGRRHKRQRELVRA